MWAHIIYLSLLYSLAISSESLEKTDSDVSAIKEADGKIQTDISDIDIHLESPNLNEPQRLDFRLEASEQDEPKKLNFQLENKDEDQTERTTEATQPTDPPQDRSREMRRQYDKPILRIKNQDTDIITRNELRIRGGNATDTKNYPYMAAIIINGRLWCTGSLVDENWVLTAAHCLNYVLHVSPVKSLGNYVKVRLGSTRPHEGGKLLDVVGAVRHPKFEEEPVPHADVALLKLSENLPFTEHINIIKIYEGISEPFAQSFVVVSGWGATRGTDTAFRDHTPDLRAGRLKVRSQHYCIDAYQLVNGFQFTADFFCASLRNGTRDACLFDAGAPAVHRNRLMGIMSFGPERCGHEFQPAVFVKAFYFRDFVKSTIASYKTTLELIEAMREADPDVRLVPLNVQPKNVETRGGDDLDEHLRPDARHD